MQKTMTLMAAVAACVAVTGCGSGFRQAMGVEKVAPDEFRVVTRAPLVVPPDYALRPPRPGDPRPQELRPDGQARAAVFGQDVGAEATPGERALVSHAGADAVDPAIRAQVDLEGAALVRKPEGFSDQVLGFQGSAAPPAAALTEEQRLANAETVRRATGGATVVIERREGEQRPKLPGL
ncbi:MAG: DUF3035 domain-containing protein [Hyphomonadaceae bacterium]|nr:MAG: hypothetical protein FD160_1996 [Caulobacteraceae bacterium]MBT9447027.1 DUF3035 domain-containing protein [Hyphomonadaceae bacterium]TPW06259.1 MAG: hypothetical protein FD124_1827 [Alphaproteobacteria bacterium]